VDLIRAAGGILWRDEGRRRVAVVHRVRKDDWSLPKGKLDPGETWQQAALREVAEETGFSATLGAFAGAKLSADRPRPKLSLYWHMETSGEDLGLADDVDEVAWLPPREALSRLDSDADRRLLLQACGAAPAAARREGAPAGGAEARSLLVVDGRCDEATLARAAALVARALRGPAFRAGERAAALRRVP
jgi:8-oxo-dGTP diphosphatase